MRRDRRRIYQGLVNRLLDGDARVEQTVADGIPAMAVQGTFFAGFDGADGSLVVRLPHERVVSLVVAGVGHEVEADGAVASDRVGIDDPVRWEGFAVEALAFVGHTAA